MKKYRIDKEIALLLCRAQTASDGGKYSDLFGRPSASDKSLAARDYRAGYAIKDECIAKAVALIITQRSSFSVFVQNCDDPTVPIATNIIYFNFKLNGHRRQISFHSLAGGMWDYKNLLNNKSHATRWEGGKGGSGRAAMDLVEAYGLNYKVY